MRDTAVLQVNDLVVGYAAEGDVLRGLSFALEANEIVGLIGASGAGKSTLLRTIQRLVEPTSGSIRLRGFELTTLGSAELRAARRLTKSPPTIARDSSPRSTSSSRSSARTDATPCS